MVHLKLMGNSQLGMIPNFSENFHHFQVNQVAFCLGLESCGSFDLHISKQSKASHISQKMGLFSQSEPFLSEQKKWNKWSTFANLTLFYEQYLRIDNTCVCESCMFHFSAVVFSTDSIESLGLPDSQLLHLCLVRSSPHCLGSGRLLHQLSTIVCFFA